MSGVSDEFGIIKGKPICTIRNDAFAYILEVDGHSITFQLDKDYFIEHYKKLGYEVIYDNSYWEKFNG